MQFIYLNVLFFMLIPALVLMYLIITKQSVLNKYFSEEIIKKLSVSNQYFSNKARNITLFFALIFMIIALARPVTNEKNLNSQNKLKPIVVAIDVSKSMKAIDIYPNRLEFAKKKLLDIIENSKENAIGIVLFAKSSFLLSPISQDFQSLKILVNNLDTGTNFDNGTNIFSLLETSNKLFENYTNKNLIILSDGGDNEDFQKEIDFAKNNDIVVYNIAIGTQKGSVIKLENGNFLTDKNGNIVNVALNENIKNLSLNTKGGYINSTFDDKDIKEILNDINKKSSSEEFKSKNYKVYTELFYYPLAIAIFLLLLAFSSFPKFKASLIILTLLLFSKENIEASILDFQTIKEAKESYKSENYENAIKNFTKIESSNQRDYDLANSFYKAKKYDEAIKLYENIKSENLDLNFQKLHNLANSYALKNDYEKAIKTYEEAIKLKNDKDTKENLELIKKLMENKNQENQQNQNSNDKKDNDKKEEDKKNDKKEQKNQKDNQKSQNNKEEKSDKKEENQEKNSTTQKDEITDFEEEKWLKQLENQKTNSLLKKMNSSNEDSSNLKPW